VATVTLAGGGRAIDALIQVGLGVDVAGTAGTLEVTVAPFTIADGAWADKFVALEGLAQSWAFATAVAWPSDNGTGAGANTIAAGDGASAAIGPVADLAVNWAIIVTAGLSLVARIARDTTVCGTGDGATNTVANTSAAGHGALAPVGPLLQDTVNWAGILVARDRLDGVWALNTTKGSLSDDITSAGRSTTTAGDGAAGPGTPGVDNAVNWAVVNVAGLGLLDLSGAVQTTVGRFHGNRA
jgi:hypothetical protein